MKNAITVGAVERERERERESYTSREGKCGVLQQFNAQINLNKKNINDNIRTHGTYMFFTI